MKLNKKLQFVHINVHSYHFVKGTNRIISYTKLFNNPTKLMVKLQIKTLAIYMLPIMIFF